METWDNNNLPENHELRSNVKFENVIKGTWNRKKQDGTSETAPKWDYITSPDDDGMSESVSVYSSTDQEALELGKTYDIIVKKAVGANGTFYGYSLKAFGEAGKPIPKKEPQSRFQKGLKLNAKAEALKAASSLFMGNVDPDACIMVAEIFEAWLNGDYKAPAETGTEKPVKTDKK